MVCTNRPTCTTICRALRDEHHIYLISADAKPMQRPRNTRNALVSATCNTFTRLHQNRRNRRFACIQYHASSEHQNQSEREELCYAVLCACAVLRLFVLKLKFCVNKLFAIFSPAPDTFVRRSPSTSLVPPPPPLPLQTCTRRSIAYVTSE